MLKTAVLLSAMATLVYSNELRVVPDGVNGFSLHVNPSEDVVMVQVGMILPVKDLVWTASSSIKSTSCVKNPPLSDGTVYPGWICIFWVDSVKKIPSGKIAHFKFTTKWRSKFSVDLDPSNTLLWSPSEKDKLPKQAKAPKLIGATLVSTKP